MSILAIIPARGGSKGVPRKNIRSVGGTPLIGYSIRTALGSKNIKHLLVSTEDQEIADIAKSLGAEVPFLRPNELAGDLVPDTPVLKQALAWYLENKDPEIKYVLLLRPTTPLKSLADIENVIDRLQNSDCLSVRTVSAVPDKFHPYWTFQLQSTRAKSTVPGVDLKKYFQRQTLPKTYFVNGLVDGFNAKALMNDQIGSFQDGFEAVVTPFERCLDIDTHEDFARFENLLGANNG
jgi:CMP-N,N'-diacetyllegionaminic acid synthase